MRGTIQKFTTNYKVGKSMLLDNGSGKNFKLVERWR